MLIALLALSTGVLSARPTVRQVAPRGNPHVFTVLIEFRNVRFTAEEPREHFSSMLNGSVRNYFTENSRGLFSPVFDVDGPVLLDAPM